MIKVDPANAASGVTYETDQSPRPFLALCRARLGCVELCFQPDPSCRQVQKTQATPRVSAIAGGHAPPACKPVRLFDLGAHARDRAVQPYGGPIQIGPSVGHPARPDALVAPVSLATIDHVPLVRTRRPLTIRGAMCAIPHSTFTNRWLRVSRHTHKPEPTCRKDGVRSTWVSVIGGHPLGNMKMDGYPGGWILLKFCFPLRDTYPKHLLSLRRRKATLNKYSNTAF